MFFCFFYYEYKFKKGGEGARVSDFLTTNPNQKKKVSGGGWGRGWGWGGRGEEREGGARINVCLHRIQKKWGGGRGVRGGGGGEQVNFCY